MAGWWVLYATKSYFCIFAYGGDRPAIAGTNVVQIDVPKLNIFARELAAANEIHCNL